jgi:DNA-binding NarL/FixJ family response regulator
VSNSRLLREGLIVLLAAYADLRLVGSYAGVAEATRILPNPPDHVVLLDACSLGQETAAAWTRYWRGLTPPARVIVIEMANEVHTVLACIEAGAVGYALQGASAAQVAEVLDHAHRGIAHCSPEITAHLFARLAAYGSAQSCDPALGISLTARELEVLRLIAQGQSNQEIADALTIEIHTVKHHVHNILQKLELRHRWDAARVAVERGWVGSKTVDALT